MLTSELGYELRHLVSHDQRLPPLGIGKRHARKRLRPILRRAIESENPFLENRLEHHLSAQNTDAARGTVPLPHLGRRPISDARTMHDPAPDRPSSAAL